MEVAATAAATTTDPVAYFPWPFDGWDRGSPTAVATTISAVVSRHPRVHSRITGMRWTSKHKNSNKCCHSRAPFGPMHPWMPPAPPAAAQSAVRYSSRDENRRRLRIICRHLFYCDLLDLPFFSKPKRVRPPPARHDRGWRPKWHLMPGTARALAATTTTTTTAAAAITLCLTRFPNTMQSAVRYDHHRTAATATATIITISKPFRLPARVFLMTPWTLLWTSTTNSVFQIVIILTTWALLVEATIVSPNRNDNTCTERAELPQCRPLTTVTMTGP